MTCTDHVQWCHYSTVEQDQPVGMSQGSHTLIRFPMKLDTLFLTFLVQKDRFNFNANATNAPLAKSAQYACLFPYFSVPLWQIALSAFDCSITLSVCWSIQASFQLHSGLQDIPPCRHLRRRLPSPQILSPVGSVWLTSCAFLTFRTHTRAFGYCGEGCLDVRRTLIRSFVMCPGGPCDWLQPP
ncbi:hypothetical protein EI94DRAFT_1722881 [Lactarius quietus]|nr:hypothetical protein EI94DRAFT_1722881 [Lactarius quietus]